jgi:hypothetical protein
MLSPLMRCLSRVVALPRNGDQFRDEREFQHFVHSHLLALVGYLHTHDAPFQVTGKRAVPSGVHDLDIEYSGADGVPPAKRIVLELKVFGNAKTFVTGSKATETSVRETEANAQRKAKEVLQKAMPQLGLYIDRGETAHGAVVAANRPNGALYWQVYSNGVVHPAMMISGGEAVAVPDVPGDSS